jgi:succinate-semialdehyde dehydrogenase / glutarate-semialdehyde dehydrogenase
VDVPQHLYIGGQRLRGDGRSELPVLDPATEDVLGSVPGATAADVDRAADAATEGFATWRRTDAWTRSRVLRDVAGWLRARVDDVAAVLTAEQGKPRAQAEAEVRASADQFDWYADEARRIYGRVVDSQKVDERILVRREPVGPVAAFTAWNFPALLPARKLAAALAAGCSVVLKPAEEAPFTALLLADACEAAGLPPGVVNVVTGDPVALSEQLVRNPAIRKLSLTGSVPVGRTLLHLAAEGITAVSMELGGHAPVLVLDDVDPEAAAVACCRAKFRNAGQGCIAPSRFFVAAAIADRFESAFAVAARTIRLGPGCDADSDMGPLANQRRVDATEALVGDAVAAGARVLAGGRRPPDRTAGFWYEPTVVTDAHAGMATMQVEPFGPIAPVARFDDLGEALDQANATPYGLASFVLTNDLRRAFEVSEALEAGMVGVNNLTIAAAQAPFGGVKHSGFGREGGTEGIDAYTVVKYVNLGLAPLA